MALLLAVGLGRMVEIGGVEFTVTEIHNPEKYRVVSNDPYMPETFLIRSGVKTEILKDVYLEAGSPREDNPHLVCFRITAPRDVKILRDVLL